MRSLLFSVICCTLIFSFSCDRHESDSGYQRELARDYNRVYTMIKKESVYLELDSTQGFFENSISQFELEGGIVISMFNKMTGVIDYYDILSGKSIKKIQLKQEGPNGVGTNVSLLTHLNISRDSIFIINGWNEEAYLLNGEGEKLKTFELNKSSIYKEQGPFIITTSNDNRPVFVDGKIYFNCEYIPDQYYKNKNILMELDLNNGSLNSYVNPPEKYSKFCWGVDYSTNILNTYNANSKEFVISFGVDHDVYTWTKGGGLGQKFIGSEYFENLQPYSSNVKDYLSKSSYEERANFSLMNPKYYKMLYLSSPKLYLREVFLPRTEEELMQGGNGIKKSLIIADESLNKVGEFRLPDNIYYTSNYILSSKGVYLSDLDFYYKNEGLLKFDLYVPEKIIR